jgi:hypothetical protein
LTESGLTGRVKSGKVVDVRARLTDALKSTKGPEVAEVMHRLNYLPCEVDIDNYNQIEELAKKLTDNLDPNDIQLDYDEEKRVKKHATANLFFISKFKQTFNAKLNFAGNNKVSKHGWSKLNRDQKLKWETAFKLPG